MRVLEPQARTSRFSIAGTIHVVEAKLMLFRRLWRLNVLSSFGQPLFYLLAMGVGVGSLVNQNSSSEQLLDGVSYVAFIAPGLLATTAMVVATIESSWPVLAGFKWERSYVAMAATPLDAGRHRHRPHGVDRAAGRDLLHRCRRRHGDHPRDPLDRPRAGSPVRHPDGDRNRHAHRRVRRDPPRRRGLRRVPAIRRDAAALVRRRLLPHSQLPSWMRPIIYVTPLWHGVELCRGATLHQLDVATALGHIAYLGLWLVAGTFAAIVLFRRRLAL